MSLLCVFDTQAEHNTNTPYTPTRTGQMVDYRDETQGHWLPLENSPDLSGIENVQGYLEQQIRHVISMSHFGWIALRQCKEWAKIDSNYLTLQYWCP